jgi:hypothetical protein
MIDCSSIHSARDLDFLHVLLLRSRATTPMRCIIIIQFSNLVLSHLLELLHALRSVIIILWSRLMPPHAPFHPLQITITNTMYSLPTRPRLPQVCIRARVSPRLFRSPLQWFHSPLLLHLLLHFHQMSELRKLRSRQQLLLHRQFL